MHADLYTALGTLFAAQKQETISTYINCEAAASSVDAGLGYLDRLGDVSPAVARCRKYFQSLKAWSEKRQTPTNAATLGDMEIPVAMRAAVSTGETGKGDIDTENGQGLNDYFAAGPFDGFLCDPASERFLDSLPADFFDI